MFEHILMQREHRDVQPPTENWLMMQKWENMLFIHWPVDASVIQGKIPNGLEVDTFNEQAWVSIVSFKVSEIRIRSLLLPGQLKSSIQLNVRTYVTCKGIRGVYFFTIDANKLLPVLGGRMLGLRFYKAKMKIHKNNNITTFSSYREKSNAILKMNYSPQNSHAIPLEKGSLSHWLLERYFLWTFFRGKLFRGAIHHTMWEVQPAKLDIKKQTVAIFPFLEKSIVHYVHAKEALLFGMKKEK